MDTRAVRCLISASVSSFLLFCGSNGLFLKSDHCNSGCQSRSHSHLLNHMSARPCFAIFVGLSYNSICSCSLSLWIYQSVLVIFPPTHERSACFYISVQLKKPPVIGSYHLFKLFMLLISFLVSFVLTKTELMPPNDPFLGLQKLKKNF